MNITQSDVVSALIYEPDTGLLKWRGGRPKTIKGNIAGYKRDNGYIDVRVNRTLIRAHRLIWLYVYGYLPISIDHINGIRDDNRLCNLRECTNGENQQNIKAKKRTQEKKSQFLGVSWCKKANKWRAQIRHKRKALHIGYFECEKDAYSAYLSKKSQLHTFCPLPRVV